MFVQINECRCVQKLQKVSKHIDWHQDDTETETFLYLIETQPMRALPYVQWQIISNLWGMYHIQIIFDRTNTK